VKDRTSLYVGLAIVVVGLLWTARGLGWLEGSAMSGQPVWAVVGPLVAIGGVVVVLRRDGGR
jgi:hypothetical protein